MPKKTITIYVCENTGCGMEDQDESKFVEVPVQLGDAKKKGVLCKDCKAEHDVFMERYFGEEDEPEAAEDDGYDPTQDRAFSKYTAEQARHHRAAKLWAVGPKSTMKGNERPKGLKGPAAPKVLEAYDAYLKGLKAEAVNGVAAAVNGKAAT